MSQPWHYVPPLPLRSAPFLHRPFRARAIAVHVLRTWRLLGSRAFMLLVAFAVWRWFSPSVAEAEHLRFDWVAMIWVRNVVLLSVVAGGLHLVLHARRLQGEQLRYDLRPFGRNSRRFLFGDQVLDNAFLTLGSASFVATAWEAFGWWAYAHGAFGLISFSEQPVWFVVLLALVPIWSAVYFSVGHWVLHRRPIYARVHSWHHRNVNVGPWSGLAMHPAEHVVLYGDLVLFLVVPSAPIHVLFAVMHHTIGAPMSHTGYDAVRLPGGRRFELGDFHHQLHHRYISCNYGGIESPLDDWIGAWHDGTEDGDRRLALRRRTLAGARGAAT